MRPRIALALAAIAWATFAAGAFASAAAAPTLAASMRVVPFGSQVVLRGLVRGASAGQQVSVMANVCGFSGAVPIGFAKTTAGGKFTYSLQPALNSTIFVQTGAATSAKVRIEVKPGVQLRRIAGAGFGIDVSSGNGGWFTGPVIVQRFDTTTKTWKPVASGTLKANSDPSDLTAVSSATMQIRVKHGTQLRAFVPQSTVGSCYLPAASPTISS